MIKKPIKLVRVWPHIEIDNKLVQEANRVIWQKLFSLRVGVFVSGRLWGIKANGHSRSKLEHEIKCMLKFDNSYIIFYNKKHFFTPLQFNLKTT